MDVIRLILYLFREFRAENEGLEGNKMDERKLEYFVASVEESSFEKAAERCNVSQTAISRQLAAMEQELGVSLFDRKNYRARLTEAGRHFYENVKKVQNDYDRAVSQLKRESGKLLTIGISGPMDMKFLPSLLISFHNRNPEILIEVKKKTLAQLEKDLEEARLDVIFGLENEVKTLPYVECTVILKSKLCVVLSESHSLRSKKELCIELIKDEPFIIFSPHFSTLHYKSFLESCERDGFIPRISMMVDTLDEMLLQVGLGRGIAIVSEEALAGTEPVISRELKGASFEAQYCVAFRKDEKDKNSVPDRFVKHIQASCE
jgi:DNA-binding transcriptional LysR family regulator